MGITLVKDESSIILTLDPHDGFELYRLLTIHTQVRMGIDLFFSRHIQVKKYRVDIYCEESKLTYSLNSFPGYIVNTAISNNSVNAIGDNVLASTKITKPRKKIAPKLKLGFRMADAVILLSHRKALG